MFESWVGNSKLYLKITLTINYRLLLLKKNESVTEGIPDDCSHMTYY